MTLSARLAPSAPAARETIEISGPTAPEFAAVQRIYEANFLPDERKPLADFLIWLTQSQEPVDVRLWALIEAREVAGMCVFAFNRAHQFGYLYYLACDHPDHPTGLQVGDRERWLLGRVLAEIERMGRALGRPPRLTHWEARHPNEPGIPSSAKLRRMALIRAFHGLGAWPLPVEYNCPPVQPGLPQVPYVVLARPYPAPRILTLEEATEVAYVSLVEMNQGKRTDPAVTRALDSIRASWTRPTEAYRQAAAVFHLHLPGLAPQGAR